MKALNKIDVPTPPAHTHVKLPCCTCSKWPVCNLREDALKTAYLIQQILGEPNIDCEVCEWEHSFVGHDFDDITIFPETIVAYDVNNVEKTGTLMKAKYRDKNHIKVLYNIEGYYVMFALRWNIHDSVYKVSAGREIYYNLIYSLSLDSAADLAAAPLEWREEMERKEEESKDADVINTTYFGAALTCDFYEWQRGLSEEEGWRRIELQYRDREVPDELQHLVTYHIEPDKVPFNNLAHTFVPMPALYPLWLPKPPCPPPHYPKPKRREDLNG